MAETVRWLRFRDGGQSYAVEEARVRAVEGCERLQLHPRPGGHAGWLLGIEGDLPVALLPRAGRGAREPLSQRPGPGGQVIVLDSGGATVGLWVDGVAAREEVAVSRLRRLPPVADTGLFSRMALVGGEIVLEVDVDAAIEQVAAGDFRARPPRPAAEAASEASAGPATPAVEAAPATPATPTRPATPAVPVARATPAAPATGVPVFELPSAHGEGEHRLLLFATRPEGRLRFGLNAKQALEVLQPRRVRPVPGAPDYLLGLVRWRDEPIAALDLEVRLGLAGQAAAFSRLLVVRSHDQEAVAAFGVERVVTILQKPFRFRKLPPPAEGAADLLRGVFEEAGQRFILPDIDRALLLPAAPATPPGSGAAGSAETPGGAPSFWA